jgi:SCP1.201-like deaminase
MPSELQRVARDLLACLDQMPAIVASLQRRAVRLRELAAQVAAMRSENPGATTAALQLDAAARACERAADLLSRVPPKSRAWTEQMVRGERTADGPSRSAGAPVASGSSGPDRRLTGLDLLLRLPVRRESPGRREKTQGLWQDDGGGIHPLISGERNQNNDPDEDFEDALAHARRLGLVGAKEILGAAAHVELKFAMRMRREGIMNAVIAVNKRPCSGQRDKSCDELLERFLPPGARLTIRAPNDFQQTYPKETP